MEEKRVTPIKAIRLKCLDCCCGSSHEVKLCTVTQCPLYLFRLGKNPNHVSFTNSGQFKPKTHGLTNDLDENPAPVA